MKTIEEIRAVLERHKDELEREYRVKELSLFGSYIRGEQQDESDMDVLVEFEEPVSLLGLVRVENRLTELLGVKIDMVPKKDLRPELKGRILQEAVAL